MINDATFNKDKLPIKNIDIIDPLGEIRRCAKEMWINDGKPKDGDWRYYWSQAEELLLSGRRSVAKKNSKKKKSKAKRSSRAK